MRLPSTVRRYLRDTGAVGQPRVLNMHVRMHGRIRSGLAAAWMPFEAEQYSFFGKPARYFYMKASRWLVPIHVYHRYEGTAASMRVKVLDLVPVASASGSEMTKAETVTMFNDMCVLAPATLIDPGIQWEPVDETRTLATFTNAGNTIHAELFFDAAGELVNFTSDDRLKIENDGTNRALPWSTPMKDYRAFGHARLGSRGAGVWHEPGGPFAYVEIALDEIAYNVARRRKRALPGPAGIAGVDGSGRIPMVTTGLDRFNSFAELKRTERQWVAGQSANQRFTPIQFRSGVPSNPQPAVRGIRTVIQHRDTRPTDPRA